MRYVYHAPLTLYTISLLLSPMPEQPLPITAAVNKVCISCSPYPLHSLAPSLSHAWATVTNHSSCKWGMYIMLPLPSTQSHSSLPSMGIWGTSFLGNSEIWREILLHRVKKYIRNGGKFRYSSGKFNPYSREINIFPDLLYITSLILSPPSSTEGHTTAIDQACI